MWGVFLIAQYCPQFGCPFSFHPPVDSDHNLKRKLAHHQSANSSYGAHHVPSWKQAIDLVMQFMDSQS